MIQKECIKLDPIPYGMGIFFTDFEKRYNIEYNIYMVYFKSISGTSSSPRIKHGGKMSYAHYLMCLKEKRWLENYEFVYHLNRDWKDDRIENLKIIDTRPQSIEVKYPYDPERYYGRRCWDKTSEYYYVCLLLKKEYKNSENLEKLIQRPINIYIAETEKLKRFLNDNEKVIYIDKDKTNYNKENLKVMKKGEIGHSQFPIGEKPFQDYRIGSEYEKDNSKNIYIPLYHIKSRNKQTSIVRSKYRYELKLGRFLKENERLVYKDGNHLNDDIDNLTHKTYPQAPYPFEDYLLGSTYKHNKNERKQINLSHKTDSYKDLTMNYARYRKQVLESRFLTKDEEVDHIDANPLNDADDNLQILTKKEHDIKSAQEQKEMAPKIVTCCDGCKNEFIEQLNYIRFQLNRKENKSNNLFCTGECRWNYIRTYGINNIKYKKLIKYICSGTGKEIELAEDMKFLPSKFNPDALPFYDSSAVLKWMKKYVI